MYELMLVRVHTHAHACNGYTVELAELSHVRGVYSSLQGLYSLLRALSGQGCRGLEAVQRLGDQSNVSPPVDPLLFAVAHHLCRGLLRAECVL